MNQDFQSPGGRAEPDRTASSGEVDTGSASARMQPVPLPRSAPERAGRQPCASNCAQLDPASLLFALGDVLNEMSSLASVIESLAVNLAAAPDSNGIWGVQALAQKIGWLADHAADALGSSQVRGDAANWFLPSGVHTSLRTVEGGAA